MDNLRAIWQGVAGNAAFLIITAAITIFLTILKVLFPHWFDVALWGLIVAALVSIIILAYAEVGKLRRQAPVITSKNVEAHIRKWLDSFYLSHKRLDEPNAVFALVTVGDDGAQTLIALPKKLDRYLVLQAKVEISPQHKAIIDALPMNERVVFNARLEAELARTKLGYVVDYAKGSITVLRRVAITANLNEAEFINSFDEVNSAKVIMLNTAILLILEARKLLPDPKPPLLPDLEKTLQ